MYNGADTVETPWRRLVVLPPAPELANAAFVPTKTPALNWDGVSGAATYELQLSKNNKFNPLMALTGSDSITGTSYTITEPLGEGVYYWRVRGLNYLGNAGAWSAVQSLTVDTVVPGVFTLKSPAVNAVINGAPQFSWNGSGGAKYYTVEIDEVGGDFNPPQFTSPQFPQPKLTSTSFKSSFSALGSYDWRVVAEDLAGNKTSSEIRKLTINPLKPAAPTLTWPPHGYSDNDPNNQITLKWAAPLYAESYILQVSKDSKFSKSDQFVVYDEPISTDSHALDVLPHGVYYWRVQAVNTISGVSSWSAVRSFTVDLELPLNKAIINDNTPELKWNPVDYAATYELQLSRNNKFNPLVVLTGADSISGTSYTISNSETLGEGVYYWRVRALNSDSLPGAWSAVRSFTVDTLSPARPALNQPLPNALVNGTTPTLSVKTVTGAVYYQFIVTSDSSCQLNNALADSGSENTKTSWTVPAASALAYGDYYWCARAIDAAKNESDWSTARPFSVTFQKSPAEGFITGSATPAFGWYAVPGALGYKLEVEPVVEAGNTATRIYEIYLGPVTSHAIPSIKALDPGKYQWRLLARTASGYRATPYKTLTILPPAPVIELPKNGGYVITNTPLLSWETVNGAAKYELQLSKNNKFNSLVALTGADSITGTSYTISISESLGEGVYYWRVRGLNYLGKEGAWSVVRSFTVDTIAPTAPILNQPLHKAFSNSTKPTLSVKSVAGAKYYQFIVFEGTGTCETADTLADSDKTYAKNSWMATTALPYGDYFWCARAIDAAENPSGWVGPSSFTVTIQNQPAHEAKTTLTTPTFTWYAAPGAIGYELQVKPAEEEDNPATQVYTISLGVVTKGVIPAVKALNPGKYQWRVNAVTASGDHWTPWRDLVILSPAPQPLAPENNYTFYTLNTPSLEFTWSESAGADSYLIEVNNRSDFKGTGISESITTGEEKIDLTMSLNAGKYYWRVAAVNYLGDTTYSAVRTLTVKTP